MIRGLLRVIKKPNYIYCLLGKKGLLNFIDDEKYIKKTYKINTGKTLNLNNPKTFNEKMQWLKLYDQKDIYTIMADKYEAKKYVSDLVGKEYIIPTLGVYEKFDDIDFNKLPNQFVIKCTHNSGGMVIVKDKKIFNIKNAKNVINKRLKKNYYYSSREWPYKNIKPRIIVEKYIKDDITEDLRDYKFMCFNGVPKFLYITVKNDNIFENYYDLDFNPIDINHGFPRSNIQFKKPKELNKMISIASKLSKGTPFLRVDLHYANGKIYFGETTFYDWSGMRNFSKDEYDIELGELIKLPEKGNK